MLKKILMTTVFVAGFGFYAAAVHAAVTAQQAAQLGTTLTPLGGEMAGSADGQIPPWTGGYKAQSPSDASGPIPNIFADEKPILTINASNVDQYTDKLSVGIVFMLKNYPGFYINVFSTHRTAVAPQWVYDNTKKNAVSATVDPNNALDVEGAYGGVPFPIPQNGLEIAWNQNLTWEGSKIHSITGQYIVPSGSTPVLTSVADSRYDRLFYDPNGSLATYKGYYSKSVNLALAPADKDGAIVDGWESSNQTMAPRRVWQYLVGQRRLRLAPNIAYDGVYPDCGGLLTTDEIYVWNGQPDRYNFKIIGKKELYIPYNTNAKSLVPSVVSILGPHYIDPSKVRWELHRVWVVDMTIKPQYRHVIPHRVIYVDEDTWRIVLADEYDVQGHLWKANMAFPVVVPALPAVTSYSSAAYDLTGGGYCAYDQVSYSDHYNEVAPITNPESDWDPNVLAAKENQ